MTTTDDTERVASTPRPIGELVGQARSFLAGALVAEPAAEREDELADVRDRARRDIWRSRIPTRFQDAWVDDFEEDITKQLEQWGEEPNRNLVLLGPVGTGKTHAAVAACREPHMHGWSVGFCPTVELLDALRPSVTGDDRDDALDFAIKVPLLILDDLAAERATEWTLERLYAIVNRRWLDCRPTVVTSNLPTNEIVAALGERLYSRIAHDALALRLGGADRRRS